MQTATTISTQRKMESLRNLKSFTKNELTPVELDGANAIAYTFEALHGDQTDYLAIAFVGKAKKHSFFYRFKSLERRADYLSTFLENIKKSNEYKEKRNQEKKVAKNNMANTIHVGTILTGSWGYEQTNREFYQVIEKPSKYKVILRPIAHENIPGTECFDSCSVRPVKDNFTGPAVVKMINAWGIGFPLFTLTVCNPKGKYYKSWGY
ncbi:hypothetical protein [Flagellimonas sp.]|uniref:hypothetical protein n=1 Tax=Flagellimonas sp. TaxID=2058762 RepID=UPI003BA93D52